MEPDDIYIAGNAVIFLDVFRVCFGWLELNIMSGKEAIELQVVIH
jgi:hypothetical protein